MIEPQKALKKIFSELHINEDNQPSLIKSFERLYTKQLIDLILNRYLEKSEMANFVVKVEGYAQLEDYDALNKFLEQTLSYSAMQEYSNIAIALILREYLDFLVENHHIDNTQREQIIEML